MGQAVQAARQRQQQQQQQPQSLLARVVGGVVQMFIVVSLFRLAGRFLLPQAPPGSEVPLGKATTWGSTFVTGDSLTLRVYLSTQENLTSFNSSDTWLLWEQKGLKYDWSDSNTREANLTLPTPEALAHNESLWAHMYLFKISPRLTRHSSQTTAKHRLTKFYPHPKVQEKKFLLGENSEANVQPSPPAEPVATPTPTSGEYVGGPEEGYDMYWTPQIEIRMLADAMPPPSIPAPLRSYFTWNGDTGQFWPLLYVNEFWVQREALIRVNATVTSLSLRLTFSPISFFKWSLLVQSETSLRSQMSWSGAVVDDEIDELKRVLKETNPYLLGITFAVSMVHMVFDFLAFKNDISFWRNRKSMVGISVKTLMLNCGCQVVIFLYLLDNETSWMIIISCGLGLAIELWKICKAVHVSVVWKFGGRVPWLLLRDRESYARSETKAYDEKAMKWLSYVLYPLVVGYAVYSLMYETHKSWYSWILSSLTGTVYTFGFIMMTPQLFINYKLKSVAHLPWRALVYKSLNTFIDDLFAFIIKMPTLHRIACFRDDVVFIIYMYQRWIYRVDKSRMDTLQWEDTDAGFVDTPQPPTTAAAAAAAGTTATATTTAVAAATPAQKPQAELPAKKRN
eukprot:TRINITY_DN1935_c0_g1_i4.p1 TRINITY_DN1935_c0_g1~~TRINITY_DN1935_c0_g1_i4.p1  ORF type:complete len:623 (-),score=189.98 TRINITY_DN1935_c0_g1_i4:51-1919(-)